MGIRLRALVALVTALGLALPGAAQARPFLPPPGKLFAGVTGGADPAGYERQVASHLAVFQVFGYWGEDAAPLLRSAAASRARLMMALPTTVGTREVITPAAIAAGSGDAYLLSLNRAIAASGQVAYIRLMAEMDGNWNAYCAFDASGRYRGASHSTRAYRQAWRRVVLIVRGGDVAAIDARLRALRMPPVRTATSELPRARVAFLWVPQVAGNPDTRANSPAAYWPGGRYVDWVGTDFYSKFPNWRGLERFYAQFGHRGKPFAFGEWALWGGDDPAFVHRLFAWVRAHRSVRMLVYNQGKLTDGPFRLVRYPRSRRAIRRELASRRFARFAPELAS